MNKNTVTKKQIDEIVKNSTFDARTFFDKCTVVAMRLPNGFVLVESSACVDPENYDLNMGISACKERLIARVWELEGYKLQDRLYRESQPNRNMEDMTIGEMIDEGFNINIEVIPGDKTEVIFKRRF